MAVRVKICGITSLDDALAAVEAGADALGFIFYRRSLRYVEPEAAGRIISKIPPFVATVGVFVDESRVVISAIRGGIGLSALQLHGAEDPRFCHGLPGPVIKAVRVKDAAALEGLTEFSVSAFLLDSYVPGQQGGTGATFNWDLAVKAKSLQKPIILAGGLTPENVADAVTQVRPYGLDVSSGVESSPGVKDHARVREFIRRAKEAASES